MAIQETVQRAFLGGELAPALGMRADLARYLQGLKTCRNFWVQRHGGVANRPGTQFLASSDPTNAVVFREFIFEGNDQTYLLEVGDEYIVFYWHGAPVVVASAPAWSALTAYVIGDVVSVAGTFYVCILAHTNHTPPNVTYWADLTVGGSGVANEYWIQTPYAATDVREIKVTQSADTLVLTHPDYLPYELKRVDAHSHWQFTPYVTAPTISAPTGQHGTKGAAGSLTTRYVITSFKKETFEESHASAVITLTSAADATPAAPNVLGWTTDTAAQEYGVYKDPAGNGIYGYIGTASSNAFNDTGFAPDFTITPPIARTLFDSTNNYPACVSYHQQRLCFGRTNTNPETVYTTKTGAFHNVEISTPLQDDDAITFILNSSHLNPVNHLVSLKPGLLVGTDEGEWVIKGDEAGVLTPSGINAEQVASNGMISRVRPVIVNAGLVYVQGRGTILRELAFDGSSVSKDLTLYSQHLFEGYSILDVAYQQLPHSIVWVVRSDGVLLGFTYVKEDNIWAWHRHDTDGTFEAVSVLPDTTAGEDIVYLVVKRHIDGSDVRYIEKLHSRYFASIEDAFFVDCGLTYDGAPATTISGLDHLEGEDVAVLADGVVVTGKTVSSGAITLSTAASVVQVGLPIEADVETLALDVDGTDLRGKRKRVQGLALVVENSRHGFLVGPDEDHLIADRAELYADADELITDATSINLTAAFDDNGRTFIRQSNPLPLTILGLIPQIEVGG